MAKGNYQKKNYDQFIDLLITCKKLFEHLTPADIPFLTQLPFPIYKDFLVKQSIEYKKEKERMDEQLKKQEQLKLNYENKLKQRLKS